MQGVGESLLLTIVTYLHLTENCTASPSEDLTDKERKPPPAPTQLDFPDYTPQSPGTPLTSASSRRLFRLLCSLTRPQNITHEYLEILNLNVTPNASFGDLLLGSIDPNGPTQILHSDRLEQIVRELRFDPWDAFREVIRLPPLFGRSRIRLSHTRRFWTSLEKMSQYWDCSMDQHYEVACSEEDSSSSSSSSDPDIIITNNDTTRSNSNNPNSSADSLPSSPRGKTREVYTGRRVGTGSSMPPEFRDETVFALVETVAWAYNCQVRSPNLPPRLAVQNLLFPVRQSFIMGRVPREKEMGRRGVLEGPVLGICSRVETSFHDHSEDGKRDEKAGKVARKIRVGGFMPVERWKETLDLAREVAVMLLLAQERARDGKEEIKPGDGKWWTSTPRWGGGPGGSIEDDLFSTTTMDEQKKTMLPQDDSLSKDSLNIKNPELTSSKPSEQSASRPKRKANSDIISPDSDSSGSQHKKGIKPNQAERWKLLRPGIGIWDRKMKYMKIGGLFPSPSLSKSPLPSELQPPLPPQIDPLTTKSRAEEADRQPENPHQHPDTIYLVSSLNHHVALLSMQVSPAYLRWLSGDMKDTEMHAEGLQLQRTRWFDLFDEGDRVEFVRGLWTVVGALMQA